MSLPLALLSKTTNRNSSYGFLRELLKVAIICLIVSPFCGCKKDTVKDNTPPVSASDTTKHLKISVIAQNLEVPWGMAFLPNGDFLFNERSGRINILKKGETQHTTIMFRNVEKGSEGGLLGLAIDPDFNNSHYIFIYETATTNQVVRLKYENGALTEDKVILSGISKASSHDGGALKFGPDGYLYVGTGDALKRDSAQLRSSLLGKILRIDKNGDAAQGNPFSTRVWSYGHRNVQGFDWMPDGKMIGIEHGPTIEFGWCCHDEINYIQPAKNYGWPLVMGDASADTLTAPLIHSGNETWAPSGCTFIKGKQWGDWENNLLVGGLKSTNLLRFKLNNQPSVTFKSDTLKNVYQRLRNVIEAPDGSIYFGSSNVGITSPMPLAGDDKIYRLAFE